MARFRPLLSFAVLIVLSGISCSHVPRKPSSIPSPRDRTSEFLSNPVSVTAEKYQFATSCNKSKSHAALSEQANFILQDKYFIDHTHAEFTSLGYVPKLAIAESANSDCKTCMKVRLMYSGPKGEIKTIGVLVKDKRVLQTEGNLAEIDFSKATPEIQMLAKDLPGYEAIECEISGPSKSGR
jgi:hypothetical protein